MSKRSLKDFIEKREEEQQQGVLEILADIQARLEKIEQRLERIEEAISEMKESRAAGVGKKGIEEIEEALELLKVKGFLKESTDLSKSRNRRAIIERLKGMGALEIRGSSDTYIVHPRKFEEFLKMLEETGESDPNAAGEKFGDLRELFSEMLRAGLIFFDVKEKKWKLIK